MESVFSSDHLTPTSLQEVSASRACATLPGLVENSEERIRTVLQQVSVVAYRVPIGNS